MNYFSSRLVELRKERGLTQKDVSDNTGIHSRAIQKYEAGKTASSDSLIKLANFFCVSVDYLLGLSDDPRRVEDLLPNEHAAGEDLS